MFYGWTKVDEFFAAWKNAGFSPVGQLVFRKTYPPRRAFSTIGTSRHTCWPREDRLCHHGPSQMFSICHTAAINCIRRRSPSQRGEEPQIVKVARLVASPILKSDDLFGGDFVQAVHGDGAVLRYVLELGIRE
jgi:hypothetical protein